MSLLQTLVTSCDFKGNFKDQTKNIAQIHSPDLDMHNKLNQCLESYDKSEWFENCGFICDEYNPVVLRDFFYPGMKQINRFVFVANLYLRKQK